MSGKNHETRLRGGFRARASICILAGALAALPVGALAQTTISTRHASVTFSGELSLTTVYRNDGFFQARKGEGESDVAGVPSRGTTPLIETGFTNADQVGGPGSSDREAAEFFMDPNLSLMFDVDVGENVSGIIELRTPFRNVDAGGKNSTPTTGFFAGFKDRTLELKQAYVEVNDMFWKGFSIRAGIQDFRKDLRGDGNAFVLDVAGSEDPFDGVAPIGLADNPATPEDESLIGGGILRTSTGFADSLEAAGGVITQVFGRANPGDLGIVRFDGWAFIIDQRFNASPGPRERYLWGTSAEVYFDQKGEYGKFMGLVFDLMNGGEVHVITAGGGVQVFPLGVVDGVKYLEVFAEAYGQGGELARNGAVNGQNLDQKSAWAFNGGLKVNLPSLGTVNGKGVFPYFEGSYVEVSGDHDNVDTNNQNFISLENNNRTLVVENGYYGFDIDTNYRGVRLAGGMAAGPVRFELLYAYFEWQDNSSNRISGGTTESRKIGDEIDISVSYDYSTALQLGLKLGWLLDSRALGQARDTQITLFEIGLRF